MADSRSSRDRKRTPDVLAELLSPELAPAEPPVALPENPSETWQVEIVSFQDHRGWLPRYVNGVEVKDWLTAPPIHDYVNLRETEGWRLTGATTAPHLYGVADSLQLYFRRRK